MRPARLLGIAAGAFLAAWIAATTVGRLVRLTSGSSSQDGVNEIRFRQWADRDPPLVGRLEEAARTLETGRAVVPVCVPECRTDWFGTMAEYALPRQAVVPAKTEGQLGAVYPTRVVRTRDDVRVQPRSMTDGLR